MRTLVRDSLLPPTRRLATQLSWCAPAYHSMASVASPHSSLAAGSAGNDAAGASGAIPGAAAGASMPSWRTMLDVSIQRSRKVRGGNYVQLATSTQEGHARVRTIVQRGIFSHNDHETVFKFITDSRSEKVAQLNDRPDAEMCWWFLKSSEQYRVRGKLTVVGGGAVGEDQKLLAIRKQQWGNLRDSAREQFYWTQPGVPLSESDDIETASGEYLGDGSHETAVIPAGGRGADGKVLPPPPTFLLLLLWPEYIDYLRLTDNCRMVFKKSDDATWRGDEVSP